MRSPGEYFLRYLFSIPKTNIEQVLATAESYSIRNAARGYLGLLQRDMSDAPKGYKPETGTHKATNDWLAGHRISEMWRQTKGAKQALRVVARPDVRERVDAILLSPLAFEDCKKFLPPWLDRWGARTYAHYFFNLTLLDRSETEALVKATGGLRRDMFYVDADKKLASLVLTYALGDAPMDAAVGYVTKRTVDMLAYKMSQLSRSQASVSDSLMMNRYFVTLASAHKLLTESEAAMESLSAAMSDIAIAGDDNQWVPSIETYLEGEDVNVNDEASH